MFNDGRYEERAQVGELTKRVVREHHPTSPKAHVPFCTQSQMVQYVDGAGMEVAVAHQYVQPDGSLGASGQPDPKRVLQSGTLYVAWWTAGTPRSSQGDPH